MDRYAGWPTFWVLLHDRFLVWGSQLCIPNCSLWVCIIMEVHAGGQSGHFGQTRALQWDKKTIIGLDWNVMWEDLWSNAGLTKWLENKSKIQDYTHLPFQTPWKMSPWTSFLGIHELKEIWTLFLFLLIRSLRWAISFHAVRLLMPPSLQIYISRKVFNCVVFWRWSLRIRMLNSWVTFGTHYGEKRRQIYV